jgi:hypothetical protein
MRGRDAVAGVDAFLDRVERARADVAEDDAERADDERRFGCVLQRNRPFAVRGLG